MPATVRIKGEKGVSLNIFVQRYERDTFENVDDANWLKCEIELSAGSFKARYKASLQTNDFVEFNKQLSELYIRLKGKAEFNTMEEQLSIVVKGNGQGQMAADCVAIDEAGIGNRLQFKIEFDQTHLNNVLHDLDSLIRKYPVR